MLFTANVCPSKIAIDIQHKMINGLEYKVCMLDEKLDLKGLREFPIKLPLLNSVCNVIGSFFHGPICQFFF